MIFLEIPILISSTPKSPAFFSVSIILAKLDKIRSILSYDKVSSSEFRSSRQQLASNTVDSLSVASRYQNRGVALTKF